MNFYSIKGQIFNDELLFIECVRDCSYCL